MKKFKIEMEKRIMDKLNNRCLQSNGSSCTVESDDLSWDQIAGFRARKLKRYCYFVFNKICSVKMTKKIFT